MSREQLQQILTASFGLKPTDGQQTAIRHISAFLLSSKENPTYLLRGFAGTGKTSLVKAIVNTLPSVAMRSVLLAPTGRAAKVLQAYSGRFASTIHRKIYFQGRTAEGGFRVVPAINKHTNTLFIVDEASMIADSSVEGGIFGSRNLLDDLISYVQQGAGCKLLLIGDAAQLPPVGLDISPALDLQFLQSAYKITIASFELTEVMRQALDSGILFNATLLREKLLNSNFTLPLIQVTSFQDIQRTEPDQLEEQLMECFSRRDYNRSVVICRSNRTANRFNQAIRNRILVMDDELSSGDLLMAVKNNYFWLDGGSFIANGEMMELLRINRIEEMYGFRFADVEVSLIDQPESVLINIKILMDSLMSEGPSLSEADFKKLSEAVEEDYLEEPNPKKRYALMKSNPWFNAVQVKFAYALTCHKTQGGQWPLVFVEAGIKPDGQIDSAYVRWLYTAITRASEKVFLIGFDDQFFA